jgi:hypothetical protein
MIKAGSAGSTPDGDTKAVPVASQPLAKLLQQLGDVTFCLNTAVVGLDAVENGCPKPDGLDISWNPTDKKIAARKSRKFILDAVLVRSAEALVEYIDAISMLHRHATIKNRWNADTTRAQKSRNILTEVLGDKNYLIESAVLMIHWRNRVIHPNSNAALKGTEKALLIENEAAIAAKYKNLSVVQLLSHFEQDRITLKDMSSLISMTINMARAVDEVLGIALSKEDLDAWLDYYGLTKMINKVRSERGSATVNVSLERLFKSQAPSLFDSFQHYYL